MFSSPRHSNRNPDDDDGDGFERAPLAESHDPQLGLAATFATTERSTFCLAVAPNAR